MGHNPLWLLEDLAGECDLRPGMRVLDLGCGYGMSSVFLAREFGVEVWAVEPWVDPVENAARFDAAGCGERIRPLSADARALPFEPGTLDAIVAVGSYHYFGTDDLFLGRFTPLLAPGGQSAIAVPAVHEEFRELGGIPAHVRSGIGWEALSFHTARWWRFHGEQTRLVHDVTARAQADGWANGKLWCEVCAESSPDEQVRQGSADTLHMLDEDRGELLTFALVTARRPQCPDPSIGGHPGVHNLPRQCRAPGSHDERMVDQPTTTLTLDGGVVEYRYEPGENGVVVIFHGGHMRAGLRCCEQAFADAGCSILVPSRPGYGRTSPSTGPSPLAFADSARVLCRRVGVTTVTAVVGISAGGRTATAFAARHPDLVERVVLISALGPLPWPSRRTRITGRLAFTSGEPVTWSAVRTFLRFAPNVGLRLLLGDLSTLPTRQVVAALSAENRSALVDLFSRMRSGSGFRNDLAAPHCDTGDVSQPTLVIASRNDGSVPFAHAEALASSTPRSHLIESAAESHLVWFGRDWPVISRRIGEFLAT